MNAIPTLLFRWNVTKHGAVLEQKWMVDPPVAFLDIPGANRGIEEWRPIVVAIDGQEDPQFTVAFPSPHLIPLG